MEERVERGENIYNQVFSRVIVFKNFDLDYPSNVVDLTDNSDYVESNKYVKRNSYSVQGRRQYDKDISSRLLYGLDNVNSSRNKYTYDALENVDLDSHAVGGESSSDSDFERVIPPTNHIRRSLESLKALVSSTKDADIDVSPRNGSVHADLDSISNSHRLVVPETQFIPTGRKAAPRVDNPWAEGGSEIPCDIEEEEGKVLIH